jgi:pilus assembly protein CpaE
MTPPPPLEHQADRGATCVVHGPKGGCGSSTIAAHLAWAIGRLRTPADTVLLDFSLNAGGVPTMLDVRATPDVALLANAGDQLSERLLRACITEHHQGLLVMAAPEDANESGGFMLETAAAIVARARETFSHVVIDIDHHFNDQTLAALAAADHIVIPTTGDLAALRGVMRSLSAYTQLQIDLSRVHVVLNRASSNDAISGADIEHLLGRTLSAIIPEDRRGFAAAMSAGDLLCTHTPRSPACRVIDALAGQLLGAEPTRRPGSLRRFFTR